MIRNFADHSANERTFLAWVRTAIAVMAFGFLVERFDLFLLVAAPGLGSRMPSLPGERFGNRAGLALIILGMVAVGSNGSTTGGKVPGGRLGMTARASELTFHERSSQKWAQGGEGLGARGE